ncbi:MetQ/NlpA family ABC transporter substrate-binding protein [Lacticaseibacillus yichunensis]|uniref:Lipoprotein n=1 Tax=Lacticaseibacillus yichunensis TaxID=2486015 RepID=A0ABW4CQ28_9LACO|nr:MetQ/NlpA family ABC transporter substrate-binding protein [Lacticaseibacillus yichunensis]
MKFLKKLALAAAVIAPVLALAACGNSSASSSDTVKVGIMANDLPIWKDIQKRLKKENVDIKLVEFSDYNKPNKSLEAGDIQLNSFQHYDFLGNWNKKNGTKIVSVGDTYIAPIRAYSNKIKSLKDLKKGDTVSVPNDPSNEGRALQLLDQEGIIKLDDASQPTVKDIKTNKLDLKISELDAAQVARSLNDVQAAIVTNDIAAAADLNPDKAIAVSDLNKAAHPWINIIAAKSSKDKDNKTYKKIVKAYQSDRTAALIKKYYKGAAVPAWK